MADFTISDFSGGDYLSTADPSAEYEVTNAQLKLSFPYAEKDANLVSYWRFKEGSGATVADETGTNGGTLANSDNWTSSGRFGNAYDFDGTDDVVTVSDDNSLSFGDGTNDSPFSISAWINMDDATKFHIMSKYETGGAQKYEYIFHCAGDDKLYFYIRDHSVAAGSRGRLYNTVLTGEQGNWLHVVATYDGSAGINAHLGMKIYIDGARVDDTNFNGGGAYSAMENGSTDVTLGHAPFASQWSNGRICEEKLYGKELSLAEVQALYNSDKQYTASGDWRSVSQTMTAGKKLNDITITHSGLSATYYIDKIEILKASDNSVLTTYSTNITSGASTTLTSSDFDNGFSSTADTNFKVKIYEAGDGDDTPLITQIEGNYIVLNVSNPTYLNFSKVVVMS